MSDNNGTHRPRVAQDVSEQVLHEAGLDGLLQQLGTLQSSLDQVAKGMGALGQNAVRQGTDVENVAAHLLAVEAVLTVILRQIPVDIEDVRQEARRRSNRAADGDKPADDVVVRLAEDLLKRADD